VSSCHSSSNGQVWTLIPGYCYRCRSLENRFGFLTSVRGEQGDQLVPAEPRLAPMVGQRFRLQTNKNHLNVQIGTSRQRSGFLGSTFHSYTCRKPKDRLPSSNSGFEGTPQLCPCFVSLIVVASDPTKRKRVSSNLIRVPNCRSEVGHASGNAR
jgi:hypothetical protein